ncbi:hypothetical protein PRUPE_7G035200 [Prunus persica]|uniref:Uncharacterized protein n=1 Tax=Prunus persica TaxID=3760 RepID=M5VW34_PRUPE|nr:hypothetical protein PRUPE_7G035200 [Prunus persica]
MTSIAFNIRSVEDHPMTNVELRRSIFSHPTDFPEKRTFLRQRVEARLASLLMESKEYSEALSVLSGLIKEVRRLVDKLLLVDIDLMRSTVRVSHRLPLVFFVVSELKTLSSSCFHCTQKKTKTMVQKNQICNQTFTEKERRVLDPYIDDVLSVKMVSQDQSKDSGSKKNGGKELGMITPQEKSSKKMKFASSSAETANQHDNNL